MKRSLKTGETTVKAEAVKAEAVKAETVIHDEVLNPEPQGRVGIVTADILKPFDAELDDKAFQTEISKAIDAVATACADATGISRGVKFKLTRLVMVRTLQKQDRAIAEDYLATFIGKDAKQAHKIVFGEHGKRINAFFKEYIFDKVNRHRVVPKSEIDNVIREFNKRNLDNPKDWVFESSERKALASKKILDCMGENAVSSAITGIRTVINAMLKKDKNRKDLTEEETANIATIERAIAYITDWEREASKNAEKLAEVTVVAQ